MADPREPACSPTSTAGGASSTWSASPPQAWLETVNAERITNAMVVLPDVG